MKKIDIEKELELENVVDIISLDMKAGFHYEEEDEGIRCVGPFYIHGRYSTINEVNNFHDVFEFNVFASHDKLDGEPFVMEYVGYDYSLVEGVKVTLHFHVYGILNAVETETTETREAFIEEELDSVVPIGVMDDLLTTEEEVDTLEEIQEAPPLVEEQEPIVPSLDLSMMEELFDSKDAVVASYSFVVVKEGDTYESMAQRYGVEVNALMEANAHKALEPKQLVVLPRTALA